MSETRLFAEAAINHCNEAQIQAKGYAQPADRAEINATVAVAQALLALRDPIQQIAASTKLIAEWCENNWRK
jgi:hypothetical protein